MFFCSSFALLLLFFCVLLRSFASLSSLSLSSLSLSLPSLSLPPLSLFPLRYEPGHNDDAVTCDIRPAVADWPETDTLVTNQTLPGTVLNYQDGRYQCSYVPKFAGLNRLEVR